MMRTTTPRHDNRSSGLPEDIKQAPTRVADRHLFEEDTMRMKNPSQRFVITVTGLLLVACSVTSEAAQHRPRHDARATANSAATLMTSTQDPVGLTTGLAL